MVVGPVPDCWVCIMLFGVVVALARTGRRVSGLLYTSLTDCRPGSSNIFNVHAYNGTLNRIPPEVCLHDTDIPHILTGARCLYAEICPSQLR